MTLLVAACASAVASGIAAASCITAVPPSLPEILNQRPAILHDAVVPAEGPLAKWPHDNTFLVPVELDVPNESFVYDVFVDYVPPNQGLLIPPSGPTTPPDGGISIVQFTLTPDDLPDPEVCPHRIEFLVAHAFNGLLSKHTPDSFGGDIVTWEWPSACPSYDAGNGTFPDAQLDSLPVAPEAGGDH